MDPLTFLFTAILSVSVFGTVLCGVGWHRAMSHIRELQRLIEGRNAAASSDDQPTLATRLEDMSAEIARLNEGQEFLSHLVASRRAAEEKKDG